MLDLVGLNEKAKQYPSQLSGGEQQRVAIARAIVNHPKILIADEPTGNLDPVTSKSILDVLSRVNELGTTVVIATHDQYMVNAHPRRTITFKNGIIYSDNAEGGYLVDEAFDTEDGALKKYETTVEDIKNTNDKSSILLELQKEESNHKVNTSTFDIDKIEEQLGIAHIKEEE